MGLLVNGEWKDQWYDTSKTGGKFVRSKSQFENQIINDENAEFKPESNRYHLYISHACPWAHRALIFRKLKKLEEHIRISREIVKVNHKLIILKGRKAEEEIKNLNIKFNYSYSLEKSITNVESKIVIMNIKK